MQCSAVLGTGIVTAVLKIIDFRILQATTMMIKSSSKTLMQLYTPVQYVLSFQTAESKCVISLIVLHEVEVLCDEPV